MNFLSKHAFELVLTGLLGLACLVLIGTDRQREGLQRTIEDQGLLLRMAWRRDFMKISLDRNDSATEDIPGFTLRVYSRRGQLRTIPVEEDERVGIPIMNDDARKEIKAHLAAEGPLQ